MIVLVMGVSGSGKTTVGEILAAKLGCDFAEGDAFHPPENVTKMQGGTPLDDEDRWPWLASIAKTIDAYIEKDADLVVACSALKPSYREILIGDRAGVQLVHLAGSAELIHERMEARAHFMPAALLASQFATLEPPGEAENPITVDIAEDPDACADRIAAELGRRG